MNTSSDLALLKKLAKFLSTNFNTKLSENIRSKIILYLTLTSANKSERRALEKKYFQQLRQFHDENILLEVESAEFDPMVDEIFKNISKNEQSLKMQAFISAYHDITEGPGFTFYFSFGREDEINHPFFDLLSLADVNDDMATLNLLKEDIAALMSRTDPDLSDQIFVEKYNDIAKIYNRRYPGATAISLIVD